MAGVKGRSGRKPTGIPRESVTFQIAGAGLAAYKGYLERRRAVPRASGAKPESESAILRDIVERFLVAEGLLPAPTPASAAPTAT